MTVLAKGVCWSRRLCRCFRTITVHLSEVFEAKANQTISDGINQEKMAVRREMGPTVGTSAVSLATGGFYKDGGVLGVMQKKLLSPPLTRRISSPISCLYLGGFTVEAGMHSGILGIVQSIVIGGLFRIRRCGRNRVVLPTADIDVSYMVLVLVLRSLRLSLFSVLVLGVLTSQ